MYEIPESLDTRSMVDQTLELISCAINHAVFHLGRKIAINTASEFQYVDADGKVYDITLPINSCKPFSLLESKVEDVRIGQDRRVLELIFSGHRALRFTSNEMYESFYIHIGDEDFII
jgi:hypothetical protein